MGADSTESEADENLSRCDVLTSPHDIQEYDFCHRAIPLVDSTSLIPHIISKEQKQESEVSFLLKRPPKDLISHSPCSHGMQMLSEAQE